MKKTKSNNSFGPKNKNNKSFKMNKQASPNLTNKFLMINNENDFSVKTNIGKENSKKSEMKGYILSQFNKKNSINKFKIKRRKSKHNILNSKINEEQKEIDRNAILQRIKNREINHEINRKVNNSITKTTNKIISPNQLEIQKTLNDIKNLNKNQQNKFCFYHIITTNNLYFYIPKSKNKS